MVIMEFSNAVLPTLIPSGCVTSAGGSLTSCNKATTGKKKIEEKLKKKKEKKKKKKKKKS